MLIMKNVMKKRYILPNSGSPEIVKIDEINVIYQRSLAIYHAILPRFGNILNPWIPFYLKVPRIHVNQRQISVTSGGFQRIRQSRR